MAKKKTKVRRSSLDRNPDETKEDIEACDLTTSGDVVEHVTKAPCSIDFSRDAKGQPRWAIKLYGERDEMKTMVVDEILAIDKKLRERSQASG